MREPPPFDAPPSARRRSTPRVPSRWERIPWERYAPPPAARRRLAALGMLACAVTAGLTLWPHPDRADRPALPAAASPAPATPEPPEPVLVSEPVPVPAKTVRRRRSIPRPQPAQTRRETPRKARPGRAARPSRARKTPARKNSSTLIDQHCDQLFPPRNPETRLRNQLCRAMF